MKTSRFCSCILASVAMLVALLVTHPIGQERRPGAEQVSAAPPIAVGPNVQVSRARANYAHYELLAGAHLTDPNKLMACSMMITPEKNASDSIVYTSVDGGRTWKETLVAHDNQLAGDPVCPYGLGDAAYFVVLTTKNPSKMLVYRSSDAGLTWQPEPTRLPFIDRENLVVDATSGKNRGRLYINGTASVERIESGSKNGVSVFRSLDGGATFLGPVMRQAAEKENVVGMGNSVVLSDGTLVTLFGHNKDTTTNEGRENRPGTANSWIRVVTSADGGETLTKGTVVADWFMDRERSQGSHIPWLAVDPGSAAFKDRLYAVWDDTRSGRLEALLSYSADKGKTWSKPVAVADDRMADDPAHGPDEIMPLVAANKDGVVGVAWYDRREHDDNLGWNLRFSASLDGGETFLPSVRVSEASNSFGGKEIWPVKANVSGGGEPPPPQAPPGPPRPLGVRVAIDSFFFSPGHTSGFVADAAGVFHPVWTDNRTGVSQLWTASVSVRGDVFRNGAKDLEDLDDVSQNLTFDISDTVYDRASRVVTMKARLKNTSKVAVHGPLRVRVIALQSELGTPSVVGASNRVGGLGAVWDFDATVSNQELKPDETSAPRELRFQLADLRAIHPGSGRRDRFGLVTFDVKVLGKVAKSMSVTQ